RAWRLLLAVPVILAGVAAAGHVQARETFTFERTDPRDSADTTHDPVSRPSGGREVTWLRTAKGDRNVQLKGRGNARVPGDGGLVRAKLEHHGDGPPIEFFVRPRNRQLDHVFFTQTGDSPVSAAGIYSRGSNYLTGHGRTVRSLGAGKSPGHLLNHD